MFIQVRISGTPEASRLSHKFDKRYVQSKVQTISHKKKLWPQLLKETIEALKNGGDVPENNLDSSFKRQSFDETFYIPRPARTPFMKMLHSMIVKNALEIMNSVAGLDLDDFPEEEDYRITNRPAKRKREEVLGDVMVTPSTLIRANQSFRTHEDWLVKTCAHFVKIWNVNDMDMTKLNTVLKNTFHIYSERGLTIF
jgi:hypothetical protein